MNSDKRPQFDAQCWQPLQHRFRSFVIQFVMFFCEGRLAVAQKIFSVPFIYRNFSRALLLALRRLTLRRDLSAVSFFGFVAGATLEPDDCCCLAELRCDLCTSMWPARDALRAAETKEIVFPANLRCGPSELSNCPACRLRGVFRLLLYLASLWPAVD